MESSGPVGNGVWLQILVLVILTMVNAFFSGAEMAVVSVNKNKIKRMADEGNKKALLIQTLFKDSTKFLSTIQVAITFAGFFSSASAATGISQILGSWLRTFNIPYSNTIAVVSITLILAYITLVFGELIPKRIALQKAESFSLFAVRPIYLVSKILSPFIKLLSISTNGFLHLIGMNMDNLEEAVSEEEIKAMLETGSEKGVFNDIEKEMINSIFSFDDKMAKDVMIPRKDVFAVDIDKPFELEIDEILESHHSKIPVYAEDTDNIIGTLLIKDLIIEMRKTDCADIDIPKILKKPFFVPETKNTDELFREMQRTQNHMAFLIDEYGGFSGLVTIEDLIEEIVGDIPDEYETVVKKWEQVKENIYIVDGGVSVAELNEKLHLELETDNYDTLSGFLIEQIGYVPKENERLTIKVGDVTFKILENKEKRIQKVRLKK